MAKTNGIQVYEILPNGCLNGTYSNDGLSEIFNEISRKKIGEDRDKLTGKYDCCYFDLGNEPVKCDLEINSSDPVQFILTWFKKGSSTEIFKGNGWLTNHHQLTIRYWSA